MESVAPLFLVEPSVRNSIREKELLQSQARSHASRISHKRSQKGASRARRSNKASTTRTTPSLLRAVDNTQGRVRNDEGSDRLTEVWVEVHKSCSSSFPPQRLKSASTLCGSLSTVKLNALCSPAVVLNDGERKVLHYLTVDWLPSSNRFPPGCQIAMFTPLLPEDLGLATEVMSRALQTPDQLHIYALLSSVANRMSFVHQVCLPERHAKEIYFGKAIRALRLHLLMKLPITDQVILDVGLLALTEVYNKTPTRSNVYWWLMSRMVCARGGLSSIDQFVAYSCVGIDYLIAAGTLTPPAFNLSANPALLGLKVRGVERIETIVTTAIADLPQRLRILCQQSIVLTQVIEAIHKLGVPTTTRNTDYVSRHNELIYRLLASTAIPRSDPPVSARCDRQAASADGLLVRLRSLGFCTWLWHISHDASTGDIVPPTSLSFYTSDMWTCLDGAISMFRHTDWAVRDELVLWIAALGTLVTKEPEEKTKYSLCFIQSARKLNFGNILDMRKILSFYPPFERVDEHWLNRLWSILNFAGV